MSEIVWPLPGFRVEVPQVEGHPGAFGAERKFDRHTGVDLYAPVGQVVVALESGRVIAIDSAFTGGPDTPLNSRNEPIWLPTEAVLIEGVSGVLLYGEILVKNGLVVGSEVCAGQQIGRVLRVLREKPDRRPYKNPANSPSMLHFERYEPGTTKAVFWALHEPQPPELLDPTDLLLRACELNTIS